MANSKLSKNDDILVKVDQNNLIYIDPNSTINSNGEISNRGVDQEKLVMYVNLEADIVARSILTSDNDKNTLTSIASGTLNFLKNKNGGDYDTSWTDAYSETSLNTATKEKDDFFQSDQSGQSFGIDTINISVKGFNAIPQVLITFIDVRGKTLFETPENSPYKAFFHIPWPIFYLTIKGYYGKAIRYRLHLTKFSTKFNESNGNFEISTTFVGSTYAYLNDIPFEGVLNAPYMFPIETTKETKTSGNGTTVQTVVRSTRGYSMLKSIYDEYKQKGLIKSDFPVKTMKEVLSIIETLDTLLEKQIFDQVVDMRIFAGLKEFEESIDDFETSIIGWGNINLEKTPASTDKDNYDWYYLTGDKTNTKVITGSTEGTLENLITKYTIELDRNAIFTEHLVNNTRSVFKKSSMGVGNIHGILEYYGFDKSNPDILTFPNVFDGLKSTEIKIDKIIVGFDKLINNIREIKRNFIQERRKLEEDVELKMNDIVKSPKNGLGFEPTIRNLFAILLANAEVLIRLMKDVHERAFNESETRKKLLRGYTEETVGDAIYPWPEVKMTVLGKENTIVYPGDTEIQGNLKSYNSKLWPEVDFIENFIGIGTNRIDSLSEKEGAVNKVTYDFKNNYDESKISEVSVLKEVVGTLPYSNKTQSSFLYEIYERSLLFTMVDSYNTKTVQELANLEFKTIKESIAEDNGLLKFVSNVITKDVLKNKLKTIAQFENYSYYQDLLPTTDYLKEFYSSPFKIEQYETKIKSKNANKDYEKLNEQLLDYKAEKYRSNIYPFNSDLYVSYLKASNSGVTSYDLSNLSFDGFMEVNVKEGFISGKVDPKLWVKGSGFTKNIFAQKLKIGKNDTYILNTPYFHNQLYSDFNASQKKVKGKYVGSAYLLLNSLPFVDLEDSIEYTTGKSVMVSSIFREISSSQYIPYHLMLKWGSIYHRYKKFIVDGVDILGPNTDDGSIGCLTSGYTTTPIDGDNFFGVTGDSPTAITLITVNGNSNVGNVIDFGIHPWYDSIFNQIVNGYTHYVISSGETSFNSNVVDGKIVCRRRYENGFNYWTQYVDNSMFTSSDSRYTLLPSDGGNLYIAKKEEPDNKNEEQNNFRIIWQDEVITTEYSGKTFPNTDEYSRVIEKNEYSINSNYRKVVDLIATFSPEILENFEDEFISFASEKVNKVTNNTSFKNVMYYTFQDLLKEIVSIDKRDTDNSNLDTLIIDLKVKQIEKLQSITNEILNTKNLIKITLGNPKEINPHVFHGFSEVDTFNKFNVDAYNVLQYNVDTESLIKLYIGEDIDTKYQEFFAVNNVKLNEENIKMFRPLALMYAGYIKNGGIADSNQFKSYIRNNIFSTASGRLDNYLDALLGNFSILKPKNDGERLTITGGFNDKPLKMELYNFFKSLNDKWISGNSIGQRNLMEEFLFLDKANKDIGDLYFINLTNFSNLADEKNKKQNLYGAISLLIAGTGFDMKALPAYVNFYGTNLNKNPKVTPSKKVAENLFGTFLDVDYQESSPKIIIQYVGNNSKRPDMPDKKKYRFSDDSFNIGDVNKNPIMYTLPKVFKTGDLSKSNKVVAFEVSFGDQNQGIFKGIQLDQATLKNTSESFVVLENIARSESGSSSYNVDIGLYDYYRQASYSCEVTMMGNVMIQPTMFFYLKNIPMFKGSYWITEVSHMIKNNNITTTFKGSRIPYTSLPDPKDSFMSSYRTLFDKLSKKAETRVKSSDKQTTTSQVIQTSNGTFTIDTGSKQLLNGEEIIPEANITDFGIPYNGYLGSSFIQKVTNANIVSSKSDKSWLRAIAIRMGEDLNPMNETTHMSIIDSLKTTKVNPPEVLWSEVKLHKDKYYYYTTNFNMTTGVNAEKIITAKTTFVNANKPNKKITVIPQFNLNVDDITVGKPRTFVGPIDVGPNVGAYGIALSNKLMYDLDLQDGDIVYFNLD
jgi:hypothetical protein